MTFTRKCAKTILTFYRIENAKLKREVVTLWGWYDLYHMRAKVRKMGFKQILEPSLEHESVMLEFDFDNGKEVKAKKRKGEVKQ